MPIKLLLGYRWLDHIDKHVEFADYNLEVLSLLCMYDKLLFIISPFTTTNEYSYVRNKNHEKNKIIETKSFVMEGSLAYDDAEE